MTTMRSLTVLNLVFGAALGSPAVVQAAPDFAPPAVELRLALGRTLAEHAFLTLEAMRTGLHDDAAFAAAGEALEENTRDVLDIVDAAYGPEAADAFGDLWRGHIGYVVDYTRALADGDEPGQERATEQLRKYALQAAELLASINPNLTVEAVRSLLEDHVRQLEQVAAFAEGDYADAYPAVRETYAHMFVIADGLARAIIEHLPDLFPGETDAFSPATDLAVALDRLLGEHALLSVLATRAALTDAPDRAAAVAALAANGQDLSDAIAEIYTADAGAAFGDLWTAHVAHYLDYVEATQAEDARRQDEARRGLASYRTTFSEFLAGANPYLSADGLERLLRVHTQHLLDQVDAFAAEAYAEAYRRTREAYAHMAEIGEGLAAAVVRQFPERYLPDTAAAPGSPTALGGLVLVAAVALFGTAAIRRIQRRR